MKTVKLALAVSCLMLASVAQASVMSWYVSLSSAYSTDFSAAKIYAYDGTTSHELTIGSGSATSVAADSNQYAGFDGGVTFSDISSYAGESYSFYVELGNYVNSTWTAVATSEQKVTYKTLYDAGVISDGGVSQPSTTAYNFNSFTATPEPGSIGLLLLGASMVLLRRRARRA